MPAQYPVLDNKPIDQWRVTELREELRKRKLSTKGLKEELIRRLDEAIREETEAENDGELGNDIELNLDLPNNTKEEDVETEREDDTQPLSDENNHTDKDEAIVDSSAVILDVDQGTEDQNGDASEVAGLAGIDEEKGATTDNFEDSAPGNQNVIAQFSTRAEDAEHAEKHEDSEPPIEDYVVNQSELSHQVSEVSQDLGFQVKFESNCTDSVSINEKNNIKDNFTADNFPLELEVKQEVVLPSSSSYPSDGGDTCMVGLEQEADKNHVIDEQEADNNRVTDEQETDKNRVTDEQEADNNRVIAEQEVDKNRVTDEQEADNNRVIAEQEADKSHVIDEQEDNNNHATDEQEADKNRVSDEQEADKNRVTDEQEADNNRVTHEQEADKNRVSDVQEVDKNRVTDEQEADENRVTDEQDADKNCVTDEQEVDNNHVTDEQEADKNCVTDEQEVDKNCATDEQEKDKNHASDCEQEGLNLLSVKQEATNSNATNVQLVARNHFEQELGEEQAYVEDADMQNATNVASSRKEDSIDVVSPEKLNLDRSSGDESMEEDMLESKHMEADIKSEEPTDKTQANKVDVGLEERAAADAVRQFSLEMKDIAAGHIKSVPSTEKRKLEESEAVGNNGGPKRQRRWNPDTIKVPEHQVPYISTSTTPKNSVQQTLRGTFSRSNSTLSGDSPKERIVPAPKKPATTSLRIDNFLRPFTLKAVQELLAKTGKVCDFWMDHIKTHCYVTYSSVEEATETRNAVYNLQWPPNGGRFLAAEFVDTQEVKVRSEALPQSPVTPISPILATPKAPPPSQETQAPQPSRQQNLRQQPLPPPPPPPLDAPHPPMLSNPPPIVRERLPPPPKKPEPPVVTLDDLFKKTRATPRIYYLPLTEEQVAAKLAAQGKSTQVQ